MYEVLAWLAATVVALAVGFLYGMSYGRGRCFRECEELLDREIRECVRRTYEVVKHGCS